jgi:predicted 3-demethylubiquinone-9 3-methyltransferase (glyoxalase superfamily)
MKSPTIVPCLWFDTQAEEAARFYVSVFPRSKMGEIAYYGEGAPRPKGTVVTVRFWLDGQEFVALNGGPDVKFTDAISLMVNCDTQAELDRMWSKLSEGGSEVQCGWLKDRYGLSWQIVPRSVVGMISDTDQARADRVMQAVWGMVKLDVAALKAAYGPGPVRGAKPKKKAAKKKTAKKRR